MGQRRGHQQVYVHIADAFSMQAVALNEARNLVVLCHHSRRQRLKQFQRRRTARQRATGNFTHDERVHHHTAAFEQRGQLRIMAAQVIDPHRGIDEDQGLAGWRLRTATVRFGWLPPSRASRRALSRSISALSASRTMAERSGGPASLMALASSASSMLMVVRMIASYVKH